VTKNRKLTWLTFIALGIGAIPAFVAALWVFMSVTSTPLHPHVQDIKSATRAEPARRWSAAVEQSRTILRAALAEQNIPGLSVAVGVGDELVWAEGLGWADLENRIQVEPEMRFRLGTASKAVTSAAVGLLLEQDRLKLDDEIQKYVPEFPKKQWPVTLRQLLAHTAGLATDAGDEGPFGDHCERPVEGLKFVADDALRFEPDTQYRYSTFGWIVVSAAIEAVTHEPFARFMKTQVLEPLGMHDTRLDSKTEEIPNRATFYFPRFAADNRYGMQFAPDVDYSCYAGSIGFLSTPSDMVRFAIGMNRGTLLKHAIGSTAADLAAPALRHRNRLRPRLGSRNRHCAWQIHADDWLRRRVDRRHRGLVPHLSGTRHHRGAADEHIVGGLVQRRCQSGRDVCAHN
jgi:CubicO group peptidase (beta-lactamase class C family)